MSLFDKFKTGLSLSSLNLSTGIKKIFLTKGIDESVLSQFEELLISADVGVETATELKKEFEKFSNSTNDLRKKAEEILNKIDDYGTRERQMSKAIKNMDNLNTKKK